MNKKVLVGIHMPKKRLGLLMLMIIKEREREMYFKYERYRGGGVREMLYEIYDTKVELTHYTICSNN